MTDTASKVQHAHDLIDAFYRKGITGKIEVNFSEGGVKAIFTTKKEF